MKQTFIMSKNTTNGYRKYLIMDTDNRTYITGNTAGNVDEYKASELIFKVSSIRSIEKELIEKGFEHRQEF